jgi:hypothetical protein
LKRDPEKAPGNEAPHEALQQRDLSGVVRWLARAAARAWLAEQPPTEEPSGKTGRSSPSDREVGPRE